MFVSFWGMRSIGMAPWVFPLSRQFEFNLCLKGGIGSWNGPNVQNTDIYFSTSK